MQKDHFTAVSNNYRKYRPAYPKELFQYLSSLTPGHQRVWDCGTGSGQTAVPLTEFYDEVIATDLSKGQLENAQAHERVVYKLSAAEKAPLEDQSVDLVTSSQAAHWFVLEEFYSEVRRVLRPGGVIALWCYGLLSVNESVDRVVKQLHDDLLGPFWPKRTIEDHTYGSLWFPFEELPRSAFTMRAHWTLEQLKNYFRTWSAAHKYYEQHQVDPLEVLTEPFLKAWGNPEEVKEVTWPIYMRHGRVLTDK
ncbi:class I SAM-dependent methyltransferase [Rapidithrix thailandica]|uniref:Class I SAM-dependent methyltransferase n=1 Tax=Rapidithrix thailandica TaxID=413964 RepID=A0AAW9RX01_9BACT